MKQQIDDLKKENAELREMILELAGIVSVHVDPLEEFDEGGRKFVRSEIGRKSQDFITKHTKS